KGASRKRRSIPDSTPRPSQTTYAVDSGSTDAAKKPALKRPKAKSTKAYWPASGFMASAANEASWMDVMPWVQRVAAQATTMNHATTSVKTEPTITSMREAA